MRVRAASIQMSVGNDTAKNLLTAERLLNEAASKGAEIVCLPEYFSFPQTQSLHDASLIRDETIELLENVSKNHEIIIAGTMIDDGFNSCLIYENGELIGRQSKVHLTEAEEALGLRGSERFTAIESSVGTLGALICADVLYPEVGRILGLKHVDIVFNPVTSFVRGHDITRQARRSLYIARAYDNGCFILKTGGFGRSILGDKLVGRSLIASPWGIIASASDENKAQVVIADLNLDLLRNVRAGNYSLRKRVKRAYMPLIE